MILAKFQLGSARASRALPKPTTMSILLIGNSGHNSVDLTKTASDDPNLA